MVAANASDCDGYADYFRGDIIRDELYRAVEGASMNLPKQETHPREQFYLTPPTRRYRVKRDPIIQPNNPLVRYIALTKNQYAIVDAKNYDWLNQWNWFALWDSKGRCFYAARVVVHDGSRTIILMHQQILPGCVTVDHIHHNTLDNREHQLRPATMAEQIYNQPIRRNNTSGYKGVTRFSPNRWLAQIRAKGKVIKLGSRESPVDAAHLYDEAATKYHGEFAQLNFPRETSNIIP